MPTARRSLARLRENNLRNDVLSRLTGCKFATQGLTFHPSCIHVAEKPKRNAKSEPSEHRPQRGRGYSEGNLSLKLLGNVLEHCTIKCIAARWQLQVRWKLCTSLCRFLGGELRESRALGQSRNSRNSLRQNMQSILVEMSRSTYVSAVGRLHHFK